MGQKNEKGKKDRTVANEGVEENNSLKKSALKGKEGS